MNEKTLLFIENLIDIEKKELKDSKIYNNVFDKYLNGCCEDLVSYLYNFNDSNGSKIEIKGINQDEFLVDRIVYHYVYKLDNKYYDINGEFDNIYDLVDEIGYIDFVQKTEEIDFSSPIQQKVLEKMKNDDIYLKVIDKIELNKTLDIDM